MKNEIHIKNCILLAVQGAESPDKKFAVFSVTVNLFYMVNNKFYYSPPQKKSSELEKIQFIKFQNLRD